ncbi:MAG: type I polyketide synthase [Chloroflexi bacterium]|nr:type I polyketide synthase [Chloroflexota bacterium]
MHRGAEVSRKHDVRSEREPIAIIGIGCRYPGGITSAASFWRVLHDGTDAVRTLPQVLVDSIPPYENRGAPAAVSASESGRRVGGKVGGLDQFDALFFRISPREAERLDPQQRLLLEVAWEALEDGGQPAAAFRGARSGIFVGLWLSDYEQYLLDVSDEPDFYMTVGSGRYAAAGRLSYVLDSQGPSLTLDTACSSSLVAVHLACRSIWQGEVDIALAGGANVILANHINTAYSRAGMLAPDGRCKFGDASANGYVRSDGAAAVILKPLSRALADGDPIYALIRGSAVNNDGQTGGHLVTPATEGQQRLLHAAYLDAGVEPSEVDYVEAHGTGTAVGDPIELRALGAVVGQGRPADQPCFVGSVKTNIGHTEGAAGVAGLIKVALALKHGEIPATLHCATPTSKVPWDDLALALPTERRPWPQTERLSRAGVSSFGITGTNAHIVLEAARHLATTVTGSHTPSIEGPAMLPLSGHTPDALRARATQIADLLDAADQQVSVADLCFTASARRTHHGVRWAAVSGSREELSQQLRAVAVSGDDALTPLVCAPPDQGGIVFVFPGQGSQWVGMAQDLLESEPVFRAAIERCERAFRPYVDWSLLAALRSGETWDRIDVVQPALFAIQVGLAELWKDRGIRPVAVVGHSMGEVGAAYIAGLLSLDDAALVICGRSRLLRRVSGQGAMAVVDLALADVERALVGYEDRLSIAVSNSSRSTVIAGAPDALQAVLETLRQRDVFCRVIGVDVASHSPQVEPLQGDLKALLAGLRPLTGSVPFYSSVRAARLEGAPLDADYWFQNLRQPVRFGQTVGVLLDAGHRVFIELSPHPVLISSLQQSVRESGHDVLVLPSLRRETAAEATLLESLATLYTAGYDINWAALYPAGGACVPLPGYPWQRERFWYEPSSPTPAHARQGRWSASSNPAQSGHPIVGAPTRPATQPDTWIWEGELSSHDLSNLAGVSAGPAVISQAAMALELSLVAGVEALGTDQITVERLVFDRAEAVPAGSSRAIQLVLTQAAPDTAGLRVFGRRAFDATWTLDATSLLRAGIVGDGAVETAAPGDDALTGALHIPETVPAHLARAALLDAALRLLVTTLPTDSGTLSHRVTGVDRVQIVAWPTTQAGLRGTVRWTSYGAVGDVTISTHQGRPVAHLSGVRLKEESGTSGDLANDGIYDLIWRMTAPVSVPTRSAASGSWVILADDGGTGQLIADLLAAHGQRCTVLSTDGSPTSGDESGPARLVSGLITQLRAGLETDQPSIRGIVDATALSARAPAEPSDTPATAATHKALNALALARALMTLDERQAPSLWIVTAGAQAVGPVAAESSLAQSPLWGFWRSLALEQNALDCRLLDLEAQPTTASVRALVVELLADQRTRSDPSGGREDQIAWRGGQRYVARMVQHVEPGPPASSASVRLTVDGHDVPLLSRNLDLEAGVQAFRRLADGADGDQIMLALDRRMSAAVNHGDGSAVRSDGAYLITGGLGALGLAVAQWLVERGARALALVGRRPPSVAAQTAIDRLEEAGARILVASADVAVGAELSGVLQRIETTMPPLRGVIHAAGVLADATLLGLDGPRFVTAMAPKVAGAWNLHTLTAAAPLDLFVMFSSVTAVLGSPGQANYSAANAFLDALAHYRRTNGFPGLSINWGPWSSIGLAAAHADRGERLVARGIGSLDPTQALGVMGHLLDAGAVSAVVMPFDVDAWRAAYPAAASAALFCELPGGEVAAAGADAGAARVARQPGETTSVDERDSVHRGAVRGEPASGRTSEHADAARLRQQLEVAAPSDRVRLLTDTVVEAAARVMGYRPTHTIAEHRGFFTMGLDSLTAIELRQRLETRLGITLPSTVAFDYPTPVTLATFLVQRLFPEPECPQTTPEPDASADADFSQMSDDELRDLLDRELESLDARSLP